MEFKDKIYNGKTIAEIFNQRGERVEELEMIREKAYLLEKNKYPYNSLIVYWSGKGDIVRSLIALFDDGTIIKYTLSKYSFSGNIYKATPDQIELLNKFENENNQKSSERLCDELNRSKFYRDND